MSMVTARLGDEAAAAFGGQVVIAVR